MDEKHLLAVGILHPALYGKGRAFFSRAYELEVKGGIFYEK